MPGAIDIGTIRRALRNMECICLPALQEYMGTDVARIVQDCIHVDRPWRYPIPPITMGNVSIYADIFKYGVRIRIGEETVGILRIRSSSWCEYISSLNDLVASGRILEKINWSVYNNPQGDVFLPLLRVFYRAEKDLYMREIHDLSNGFLNNTYNVYRFFLIGELMSGSANLRYTL